MAFSNTHLGARLGTNAPVVVRLFSNGGDAQQAIGDLREQGFSTRQIGAAFRESSSQGADASDLRLSTPDHNQARTGSSTEHSGIYSRSARIDDTDRGLIARAAFGGTDDSSTQCLVAELVNELTSVSARQFVTGGVELGLVERQHLVPLQEQRVEAYDYAYSRADFEGSLTALGLRQREARAFALQIGPKGAIVTVAAGSRLEEAERILERNHGRAAHYVADAGYGSTQYGQGTAGEEAEGEESSGDRIQLFGEVHRAYAERHNEARDEDDDSGPTGIRKFA